MRSCTNTFRSINIRQNILSPYEMYIARQIFPSNCGPSFSGISFEKEIINLILEIKGIYEQHKIKLKDEKAIKKIIDIHHEHLSKKNPLYDHETAEKYIYNGKYIYFLTCNWLNFREVYNKFIDICLDIKSYFEVEQNLNDFLLDYDEDLEDLSPSNTPTVWDIKIKNEKLWNHKSLRRNKTVIDLSALY